MNQKLAGLGVPVVAQRVKGLRLISMRMRVQFLASLSGSSKALIWCRPAAAARILHLAWELP